MRSESVTHNRPRNISPERVSKRSELARVDKGNPSARTMPRGQQANPLIAQRSRMSDEELGAQAWLDEQLVKFYRTRNGRWRTLRQFFARAVGGWRTIASPSNATSSGALIAQPGG